MSNTELIQEMLEIADYRKYMTVEGSEEDRFYLRLVQFLMQVRNTLLRKEGER